MLHFLVLGAALFGLFSMVGKKDAEAPAKIVISASRVATLADRFARTWRRPPTEQELQGLVEDYIRDEIFYREGRAAGLDRDDVVIRRRVRQKMEFLAEDMAAAEPSEEQLAAYLASNPERFRTEDRLTFHHVFLSATRRGSALDGDAKQIADDTRPHECHQRTRPRWAIPFCSARSFVRCRKATSRAHSAKGSPNSCPPWNRAVGKGPSRRASECISSSSMNERREACRRSIPSGRPCSGNG